MLEPEHVTVGAAPMSAAPKKAPLLQTVFHVVLFFSCRVSLAEYNRVLRVLFPLLQVIEGYLELTLCVETSWWAQRGFLHATTVVFIYNPH